MNAAAQLLPGKRDFSTFRAANCQSDGPVKTLDELTVMRVGEEIHVRTRARSFLYHQVRNMVGSLKLVGEGKWTLDDFARARDAADRTKGGPTAPPDGLYLTEVVYPDPRRPA
jgi:tRNA pseudouridine38-40 synthase